MGQAHVGCFMGGVDDNRELVRRAYELFANGDIEGMLALHRPDSVWRIPGIAPWAGTYCGHDEIRRLIATLNANVEIVELRPREFLADGDKVAVLGHVRGRVRATGRSYSSEFSEILTVEAGQLIAFDEHIDTLAVAKALEP